VKSIRDEKGNAILEGVAFAAVAFGLVMVSGLEIFQVQSEQIELQRLARNVMREHSVHPDLGIGDTLANLKSLSQDWKEMELSISLVCTSSCQEGDIEWLSLSGGGLTAVSFGVVNG